MKVALSEKIYELFDPVAPEAEAMFSLAKVTQGNQPLIDYVIDFQTLAEDSDWGRLPFLIIFTSG